jgi:hypothetical protein
MSDSVLNTLHAFTLLNPHKDPKRGTIIMFILQITEGNWDVREVKYFLRLSANK